jgi:N-methylhydantoinase A/oxoprolinase/acetone carboxylase beta subunit
MTLGWIVGLDIGGTFTDVVAVHPDTGGFGRFKCLSTPDDPARGALTGINGILEVIAAAPSDIAIVLHATTLVSNALIERKGARTALLMTKGFRDTLDIAREKKFDIYDLQLEKPVPLIPPALRFEADERVTADGAVLTPLDEAALARAAAAIRDLDVEAVAVCFIHAYMNPVHERRARDILQAALGDIQVSLSSDVLPEMREYERASTTAANAYVQPVTARYLARFAQGLLEAGLDAALFIMLSEGGLAAPEWVRRFPVRICESGPAAGAVTAASIARQAARPRVLSFDMGGTTAKTALIHDGAPEVTTDFEVARTYRFKKGSGLPLRAPVVDLIEIGAGGGSIVRVNNLGLIKVGPDSVGADPGPACYGRGGALATVTDADLVLGYLDGASFLGGRMAIDKDAARSAIERTVAAPLGLSVEAAALGIHAIVNETMANASRIQAVERGHEPAAYAMVAFGGAGPVHAWGVARRLRMSTLIIPPSAGLGSALGLMLAPRAFRVARTLIGDIDAIEPAAIETLFAAMIEDAAAALRAAVVPDTEMIFRRQADMRYRGQRKELTIDLPAAPLGPGSAAQLREAFETAYRRIYHRVHAGHPIESLSWRLTAEGPPIWRLPETAPPTVATMPTPASALLGHRPMLFEGFVAPVLCPVYSRYSLRAGVNLTGPVVVEEAESTTVVGPGSHLTVDSFDNLVISLPTSPGVA